MRCRSLEMSANKKGGAEAPPFFNIRTLFTEVSLALRVGSHRIWGAAVLRNLMRRGGEATGAAAGLRIAAARSAGHAGSSTAVARSGSLS